MGGVKELMKGNLNRDYERKRGTRRRKRTCKRRRKRRGLRQRRIKRRRERRIKNEKG